MNKKNSQKADQITSTLATSEDGTIQITFRVPFAVVKKNTELALKEIAKDTEIAGFRKGKAPIDKVKEKVSQKILIERVLNQILPKELTSAFLKYKIKPVMYPKVELLSSKDNEDWQIRIVTCELPEIVLGDYKKAVENIGKVDAIWTPQKGSEKDKKSLTPEQKEQEVIKAILTICKVKIPKVFIDEEVNSRLAKLLQQIEKLGLTLDNYLASIGKSAESLREEYKKEAENTITIELALNKIAQDQAIKIKESDIDSAIKASSQADSKLEEQLNNPQQRKIISTILQRREALNKLIKLIP